MFFQLVKHVKCNHHSQIHIYELCCQKKIALQICSIHNVYDNVRLFVNDVVADIFFFWTIC